LPLKNLIAFAILFLLGKWLIPKPKYNLPNPFVNVNPKS